MAENNKGNLKHISCAPDARMTRLRTRSAVKPKHTPASCNTADGLHGDNSEPKPGTSSDHPDTASSSSGRKTRSCSRSRSKKASSSGLEGDGVVKKRSRSGGKAAKEGSAVNNFTKVKSRNRTNSETETSSKAPETGPGVHSEAASTSGISNPLKGKMNIGSAATASCSSDTSHTATSQTVKGKSRPRKKMKLDSSEQGIAIEKRRSLRLREIYELKPSLDVVEFRSYQSGVLADSDHLNKLSIEVMCHIFQFLTLKELLRLESMSSKIQQAVRIILTSVTEIDFLEDVRDIRLFEDGLTKLTNKALMALVTKIPKLRTIKNFHPANLAYGVFDLKLNTYGLTVLGIVWAFMSSKTLEGIEISNIHLLTRVIVDLPHLNILGRFANRERVFPTDPDVPWCNLRDECRITNLHLVGCVVSHLPPMDNHLQHLYLRFVKFMHPQGHPFKDFSACKLKTFVMSHCIGPVSTLKYIPLLTALADATSLTCLELQRVPFLGGVIQHICDDNWQNGGFRRLSSIKMGACKNALDADLGFLAIAAAPYLETLQIQPSLTKDAFFYALSMAGITVNPAFNKLCIGWTDVFPDKDKWSNNQLLTEGFAEEGDSLARISDAGMKIMGTTFMNTSTLEISGCPHLNNPLNWLTAGQLSFRNVTDLTLRDCHAMDLEKLCAFVTCLSSLEYLTLQDMVPEPPIGCSRVGLSAGTGLGAAKSLLNPPANPGPPADDLDDPPDRQEVRAQFLGHRHVRDAAVHAGNAAGNAGNAAGHAGNAAVNAGNAEGHDGNESESANENEENRLENDRRSRIKRRNRHKSSRRHRSENDGNSSHNLRSSRSSRRRRSSSKRSRRRSSQSGDPSHKAEAPSNGNHRDKHRKRSKRSRRRHVSKHDNDSDSNEEGSSDDQDSNSGGGQPSCSGATRSRSSRSETSHTRHSSKHDDDPDNTSIHNQPSVSHATRSRSFTRCDKNIQANSENNDSDDQQGSSRRKGDNQGSPGSRSVERSNQRSQGSGQKSNRSVEGASRLQRGSSHDDDDGGAETQNRVGASKRGKALVTKRGLVCKVKKRKGVEDTAGNCGKRDEKQERTQKPKIVCTCKVETRDVGCQLGSEDLKTFAQNPQRSRRRSKLVTAGQFKPSLTRPSTVVTKCLKHPYIKSRPKPCQRHQNDGTSDPIWEEDPKRSFFVFHSHIKYIKFDNVGITDLDIGATNIHTISITRCRVLKNIKFMSAPMLQNIHVSQCPKFDEMELIQEIRNIPPNTSKFVSLRPMHVDMIYIPNKFTSCGENPFGTAVMYDHSPTPSLTHYNKLRMKAWKPLLERITMSAMKDYGWKLDRDLEYPENNIDHIKAQSVDGSLLKVATDIPWIKMLTECKDMEPQNISDPEWLKDGAYCMEAKGHFSFHDAYEDIQEDIAKHPNNLYGLSECNILVYINTCDISGTPNPDAFALL